LPKALLEAIDRKARSLRISRNQLIVRALEREVHSRGDWSPGFIERLGEADPGLSSDVDDLVVAIRAARRSKPSTAL
jgi:hypothetical protein